VLCSIGNCKDLWPVEMISEHLWKVNKHDIPMQSGIDRATLRVFLRFGRCKSISQCCILQSQISLHVFAVCIASDASDKRVIKGSGGHGRDGKETRGNILSAYATKSTLNGNNGSYNTHAFPPQTRTF
jgi:hypothetical protein